TVRLTGLVAPTHTWSDATSVRGCEIVATAGPLKRDPVERSGREARLRCQGGAEATDVRGDQITKSAASLGILWNSRGHYGLDIERARAGLFTCSSVSIAAAACVPCWRHQRQVTARRTLRRCAEGCRWRPQP